MFERFEQVLSLDICVKLFILACSAGRNNQVLTRSSKWFFLKDPIVKSLRPMAIDSSERIKVGSTSPLLLPSNRMAAPGMSARSIALLFLLSCSAISGLMILLATKHTLQMSGRSFWWCEEHNIS